MAHRYSLRIESGERAGEQIPIAGEVFTIGRKASNSLQINEPSVSGQHAQLRVEDGTLVLEDLGSTNGTRVGNERVLEVSVGGGAQITFGNVRVILLDLEASSPPAGSFDGEPGAQAGGSYVVSAEKLKRSRKSSNRGLWVMAALVLVGGGAYWFLGRSKGDEKRVRSVQDVAGNLLADGFSFEGTDHWEPLDEELGSFVRATRARYSGEFGISAELELGEGALHASPAAAVRSSTKVRARAQLRAPGSCEARLGLEFRASGDGPGRPAPVRCFGQAVSERGTFQPSTLEATVPAGYDSARVLILARASSAEGGRVDADDVDLLAAGEAGPAATMDEYDLYMVGASLNLFKVDRTLLSGVRLAASGTPAEDARTLDLTQQSNGFSLGAVPAGGAVLTLHAEGPAIQQGVATMGAGGYDMLTVDFEQEGVTDVLFGEGVDLVRLAFGAQGKVRGRRVNEAFSLRVELPAEANPVLQVRFKEEREKTINLAADAEAAERGGRLGDCLRSWQELLDRFPFEAQKVARAESVRARLIRTGLEEVREVAANIERAEFFRLVELYRECRMQAAAIALAYVDSEVEQEAAALVSRVDGDLAQLESDLEYHELMRLKAILATLDAQGAKNLGAEMRSYLAQTFGEEVR